MLPTVQTIFTQGFSAYASKHKLPSYIHHAAWSIINCRTASLGGHIQACPQGHFVKNHYNSCRHRVCPTCAYIQVQKWLEKQNERLLPCDHYHVIFTIAHELNTLWRYNTPLLTKILFQSARDTIIELLKVPKYLGAKPGIIAALHTWTKKLQLHPHIHCLVTGGGIQQGKWIPLQYNYLFPFATASELFKGKMLGELKRAYDQKRLTLPPQTSNQDFHTLLNQLWQKKWNVKVCEKYTHGKGVITYLARYLKGGPIANSRIVKIGRDFVTFHVGRKQQRLLTLPIQEFISRFIQHIPQPSTTYICSYGLYTSSNQNELAISRAALSSNITNQHTIPTNWQDILANHFSQQTGCEHRPWQCPLCGQRLVVQSLIPKFRHKIHIDGTT